MTRSDYYKLCEKQDTEWLKSCIEKPAAKVGLIENVKYAFYGAIAALKGSAALEAWVALCYLPPLRYSRYFSRRSLCRRP